MAEKKRGSRRNDKRTTDGQSTKVVGVGKNRRSLKIAAVVVISLFVLIVLIGIVRYAFHPGEQLPTDAQVSSARTLVSDTLAASGDDIAKYDVVIAKHLKTLGKRDGGSLVLEVSLISNTTRHIYLVDVNTNAFVMHSQIDVYAPADGRAEGVSHEEYRRWFGACHMWDIEKD